MSPVEQQIAKLKASLAHSYLRRFPDYLLVGAAILVVISVVYWHLLPFMLAVFLGLVALASRETVPLLQAAIQAYETVGPVDCQVTIAVKSDSDNDSYYVVAAHDRESEWRYEFIPQGWKPVAGVYAARMWTLPSDTAPNLIAVKEGVMIPRNKPKLLRTSGLAHS